MTNKFALNAVITGVDDNYTVDFNFVGDDDIDIEVNTEGNDLEQLITDTYNQVLEQISLAAEEKNSHEDMTDAEYIAYLENRVVELSDELQKEKESVVKKDKKYSNQINYNKTLNPWRKAFKDLEDFEDFFNNFR